MDLGAADHVSQHLYCSLFVPLRNLDRVGLRRRGLYNIIGTIFRAETWPFQRIRVSKGRADRCRGFAVVTFKNHRQAKQVGAVVCGGVRCVRWYAATPLAGHRIGCFGTVCAQRG